MYHAAYVQYTMHMYYTPTQFYQIILQDYSST